ncbi:MAG: glutathione S-transferase family protein [Hyphomicrobiaceae bacterium]
MLTLFGNLDSGNVHKVQMILHARNIPFRRVDVRQDRGQPRDPHFRALNPMGKVPAVLFGDGDVLSDSGALLFHFADDTGLWPPVRREQADVLRWMFFEQYNHEPALAVLRYLKRFAAPEDVDARRIADLVDRSRFALGVMEQQLETKDWITGRGPTIADIALYPYTHLAAETGLESFSVRRNRGIPKSVGF